MTNQKQVEIICPACGSDSLLKREPVYEGLKKTGEKASCSYCGHVFTEPDKIPFKNKATPKIFDKDDLNSAPQIFEEDENKQLCRYCAHYVVNPFIQWCALNKREVEATDTCSKFTKPVATKKTPETNSTDRLRKLLGDIE
ncbi:MAG: hypothetical protein GX811_10040 [Lentisphaerae bacterium]|jgi:uncharacterized Zn-finger protein|nr:hypothetical protein [Lentisphaerota bacterium]